MEFHARMEHFLAEHADTIQGTLSCFDRILFRGYLPFFSGAAFAAFLDRRGIRRPELKSFLLRQAARLKEHARSMAAREGRPFQYFEGRVRKEELARQIAERDRIERGLVCVFSTLEPCRTYAGTMPRTSNRPGASACSSTTTSWTPSSA